MKYGQREIIDVYVFDEEGKKITEMNSLKRSAIFVNVHTPHVYVTDALLDTSLLKFIGKEEVKDSNDYDSILRTNKYSTTITLGKRKSKICKLIGKGLLREENTGVGAEFLFEIPKAELVVGIDFEQRNEKPSEFDVRFNILPYNEDGDLVKMHIE